MYMKSVVFVCFLVLAASLVCAMHPVFQKADRNKDGRVDREEFSQYMKESAYDELDKDKDKNLSQSEWDNTHNVIDTEKYKEVFKSADRDRDKRISFPEFSNYAEKYSNIEEAFMLLDKDKDGALASDEISNVPAFRLITIHF